MTSHERIGRMYAHREADRIPVIDSPWRTTIERWHREGMPEGVSFVEYFDLERIGHISVDNSPRYPAEVIEQTPEYRIFTTSWGETLKEFTRADSTPDFLDFRIIDRKSWEQAKQRMRPAPDRIPWEMLKREYPRWRREGHWIEAGLWFGFDVTHSWTVGT